MAQKKWRQVKVKVKGKTVNRWTDGSGNYRLAKPAASGAGVLSNALRSAHNALGGNRGPSDGWRAAAKEQRNPRRSDGQVSPRPSKEQKKATATPKTTPKTTPKAATGSSKAQQEIKAAKERTAAVKARAAAKANAAKAPAAPKLPARPSAPKATTPPKAAPKKSNASTYRDKADTKGTSVGRYKTFKEHKAAVAAAKLSKGGKNVGPVAHGGTYASELKKKKK